MDSDIKIAALSGGIEIFNLESTRCDHGFINHITLLTHRHPRITVGDAMDHRGKAALTFGKHGVIRHHLHPPKLHAVKYLTRGVGITDPELAFQRLKIPLQPGRLRLPVTDQIVTPAGRVTQTPCAKISPTAQAQQRRVPAVILIAAAAAREVVVHESR